MNGAGEANTFSWKEQRFACEFLRRRNFDNHVAEILNVVGDKLTFGAQMWVIQTTQGEKREKYPQIFHIIVWFMQKCYLD